MGDQLVKHKFSGTDEQTINVWSVYFKPLLASCNRAGVTLCRSYPLTQSYQLVQDQLNESLLQSGIVKNKARYEELKITLSTNKSLILQLNHILSNDTVVSKLQ